MRFGEITTYSDTLTWDGDTTGQTTVELDGGNVYCKISDDCYFTIDDVPENTEVEAVVTDGINTVSYTGHIVAAGDGIAAAMLNTGGKNVMFSARVATAGLGEAGTYFMASASGGPAHLLQLVIPGYAIFPTIESKQLDEAYLPESVESVVVRSSTEGSTKKFRITVDDSGTITATEVT